VTESTEFSRIAATAATLGDDAADRHRFLDKHVLLTGEGDFLQTANGRHCLLAALHLLPRICANVAVALPEGDLLDEARAVAARIAFRQQIEFVVPGSDADSFDSILSVGTRVHPGRPWTVFHNDGWLARVSSGGTDLRTPVGRTNPISALAAASLGVADTFKRLLGLRPSRGPLCDGLSWSLATYGVDADDVGPELPDNLPVDLLLGGAGAIGNGVLFLLSRLPLRGRILVVDSQKFGPENLGTCILIGPEDLDTPKVVLAERLLAGDVVAKGFHEPLESFIRRLGSEMPYPKTIVGALDNIDARHSLQDLWPDLMLDGAIGPFLCQASRHPIEGDVACARCLFRHPAGERAEVVASRATGLTIDRAAMPDAVVEASDLAAAPAAKRAWLARQLGKPICSVVSEATTRELSDVKRDGFEPSVPFVATLASSMIVAELVKAATQVDSVIEPRFQFDVLRGPATGQLLPQERRRDCYCTARTQSITTWRRTRANG